MIVYRLNGAGFDEILMVKSLPKSRQNLTCTGALELCLKKGTKVKKQRKVRMSKKWRKADFG